ncbi:uncharacterized protein L969DRAFT_18704 [Mixia osmundae IAM 14324]|uniref:Phosphoglycerate mutase n=1 Tax=Mixia osmundae (strain CBS 9802 / IAM 14324 / JCM 22182 / KY 12970) TaxID=764103 RepID=G7DSN0_MIXOS|nr:uncharacterized protein L969DRAFT_18704 [Mixia osmundae IAM 14324]KEI37914.1 hypothetical protein L969DRAFT_18704 [Mixia osmundae IAM 14324]GAA93590.1 hypothetical protein E5Q_00234 [Mixia osmundae IAM 14324]
MAPRLPRVYVVRHGETEWSLSGQHTGTSDIPLTANGEKTVRELGKQIAGPGKLLCPQTISHVYLSPRKRAQRTFELLFESLNEDDHKYMCRHLQTTDDVREWDYGAYEGLTSEEIREKHDPDWDIWTKGCPDGESPDKMQERVDKVVHTVAKVHEEHWQKVKSGQRGDAGGEGGDVLIVTHGHFSKTFLTRWCKLPLKDGRIFVVDAGGVSVGGYQHHDLKEQSLLAMNLYAL